MTGAFHDAWRFWAYKYRTTHVAVTDLSLYFHTIVPQNPRDFSLRKPHVGLGSSDRFRLPDKRPLGRINAVFAAAVSPSA